MSDLQELILNLELVVENDQLKKDLDKVTYELTQCQTALTNTDKVLTVIRGMLGDLSVGLALGTVTTDNAQSYIEKLMSNLDVFK